MTPHVHISAVHGIAFVCLAVIIFGTAHLLTLSHDSRISRAILALGF